MREEKAAKEAQWLQSLDDDQSRSLSNDVRTHIIQQHVEKLRQKKLRYHPPLASFMRGRSLCRRSSQMSNTLGHETVLALRGYVLLYLLANNKKCLNLSKWIAMYYCGISQERYVFVL